MGSVQIYGIVDEEFTALEVFQDQLDAAEEEILWGRIDFKPAKPMHLCRNLLSLRWSLVYEREILAKLCRRDSPFISEKAIYIFFLQLGSWRASWASCNAKLQFILTVHGGQCAD